MSRGGLIAKLLWGDSWYVALAWEMGITSAYCSWCRRFSFVVGKRTRDFAFVSLCYGRSGEEICTGYAMAASGRMQYDYKQTNCSWCLDLHAMRWMDIAYHSSSWLLADTLWAMQTQVGICCPAVGRSALVTWLDLGICLCSRTLSRRYRIDDLLWVLRCSWCL